MSTPTENAFCEPLTIKTDMSKRALISVNASKSSSIIEISMMFKGGLLRVRRAMGALSSRAIREYLAAGCVAIVILCGRGRPHHTISSSAGLSHVVIVEHDIV